MVENSFFAIYYLGKHPFKLQEAPLQYLMIVSEGLNDNFPGSYIREAV
jgi:hypothetical protein